MEDAKWLYQNSNGEWIATDWGEIQGLYSSGEISRSTPIAWEQLQFEGITYGDCLDSEYFFESRSRAYAAVSEDQLHQALAEGRIGPNTKILGWHLPSAGISYEFLFSVSLRFEPGVRELIEARKELETTVLAGPNNSGKSLLLKLMRREFGPQANYLACNRFYHMDYLNLASGRSDRRQRHAQFVTQLYQHRQNLENTDWQLVDSLSRMKDDQRQQVLNVCSRMLGETFTLKQVDPDNQLSQRYIDVGGDSLATSSTGTRLLLMIVAACFETETEIVLVDEPELGLSPALQRSLATYLLQPEHRAQFFPHIKQVFIVTHSHIFLDRRNIRNNFCVTKSGGKVAIEQVQTMSQYHNLQFNLLGNDLESLLLPSAIIITEGETDSEYLRRVLALTYPNARITAINAGGEGSTKERARIISQSLGDLAVSPYRERLLVVLDSQHSVRPADFAKYGVPDENVIIFNRNGIEYYYPKELVGKIFLSGPDAVDQMAIGDSYVELNGVRKSKKQLCSEVIQQLTPQTEYPAEFSEKILRRIGKLVG